MRNTFLYIFVVLYCALFSVQRIVDRNCDIDRGENFSTLGGSFEK